MTQRMYSVCLCGFAQAIGDIRSLSALASKLCTKNKIKL